MSQYKTEKAVFVGVVLEKGGERKVQEYLDELQFLAETAGAVGDKMFMQRMDRPDKATYIGTGKLQEIKEYCAENEIQYVIFDDELTGTQQRNIEKIIECSDVIDRTSLILEIFAQRAKTSYAKTQVELAHYQYMLPRLAGMGRTWSGNAAAWEPEAVWVKPRSRWTAVSSSSRLPSSRRSSRKWTGRWPRKGAIEALWCV